MDAGHLAGGGGTGVDQVRRVSGLAGETKFRVPASSMDGVPDSAESSLVPGRRRPDRRTSGWRHGWRTGGRRGQRLVGGVEEQVMVVPAYERLHGRGPIALDRHRLGRPEDGVSAPRFPPRGRLWPTRPTGPAKCRGGRRHRSGPAVDTSHGLGERRRPPLPFSTESMPDGRHRRRRRSARHRRRPRRRRWRRCDIRSSWLPSCRVLSLGREDVLDGAPIRGSVAQAGRTSPLCPAGSGRGGARQERASRCLAASMSSAILGWPL